MTLLIGPMTMAAEPKQEKNLDAVYFLALDGDVRAAMEKLNSIDQKTLAPEELKTRQKYLDRFGALTPQRHSKGHTLAEELIGTHQDYWDRVLLRKLTQEEGYHYLFERLAPVVKKLGGTIGPFSEFEYDRVASFLTTKLRETGYFAKIGNVSPHLNLMLWKTETTKPFHVDLGDGQFQDVSVVLMEGFESLGWAAYATFDKLHVGGWVEEKSLHCVASAYDLESENFKVSFLAHEARHFADKKAFPRLKSVDLEYRAKLNELILADQSFEPLIKKFLMEQKDNPNNPHSYASFLMIKNLSDKLSKPLMLDTIGTLDKEQIRRSSRALLQEHTARLKRSKPLRKIQHSSSLKALSVQLKTET